MQPKKARRPGRRPPLTRRPWLERLEERTLLSVTIAPTNNGGKGYVGLDFNQSGGFVPPDTAGAAGPTNYVETVNQTVAIYSPKATGASEVSDSFNHFWYTVGGLTKTDPGSELSDPMVTYDNLIGRFVVGDQDVDFFTHVSNFDLAVSKTGSPASLTAADWNFYQISTTEQTSQHQFDADYPGNFGYNHDAFVFTLNMFEGTAPDGPGGAATIPNAPHVLVTSVSAADLASGVSRGQLHFFQNDLSGFSVRPTTMHDSVAGDPMWLVAENGNNTSINVIKMTNVLSNTATFTTTNLAVTPYTDTGAVPPLNPDGSIVTARTDSRILKAAEANHLLVATHAVSVSSTEDDAQWYAIDVSSGTPVMAQQGRVSAGNNTYVYYPAIDINAAGDIGMTYMKSGTDSSTDFMSMYVTGRLPTDPTGTMQTPVLVPAGAGQANYKDFDTADPGRAGDMSGINVDPVDGSFWAANEFANTEAIANWGTAVANFTINSPLPSTDMAVTASGPSSVPAGGNATYTITLTNKGPNAAQGVVLTDTLPAGSVLVSITQTGGTDAFTPGGSGGTVTETANGTIAAGSSDTFTLVVTASASLPPGTTFNDTAAVAALNPDPNLSNNTATVTGSIALPATDMAVTLSGPSKVQAGTLANYVIGVTNNGPVTAQGVVLTDTLPAGAVFETVQQNSGSDTFALTLTSSGFTLTANGPVAPGSLDSLTLVVLAPVTLLTGAAFNDTITVTATNADPNTANNTATVTGTITPPPPPADLAVTASGPSSVRAGGAVAYTLTLTNNGPNPATGVVLSDILPTGATFVSMTRSAGGDAFTLSQVGGTIEETANAAIAPGSSDTFSLVVSVPTTLPDGTVFNDAVTVRADNTDPNPNNNSALVLGTITRPVPSFSGLSAPTIAYGTASVTVSGHLDGNAGGQKVPPGETVAVRLLNVTLFPALDGNDNFSATFGATGALLVSGSPYTLSFNYLGDGVFDPATATSTLTVTQAPTAVAMSLNTSLPFSASNQTVPLTATVTTGPGPLNEGAVTFTLLDGQGHTVGNPVTSGTVTANLATAPLVIPGGTPAGTYTVRAQYSDGATGNFAPSANDPSKAVVTLTALTTTTVVGAAPTVIFADASQGVSLSATVTSSAGPVNEGKVTFTVLDGQGHVVGTPATSGTVAAGAAGATFTLPGHTAVGTYTVQARYVDTDTPDLSGSSGAGGLTVAPASSTTAATPLSFPFSESPRPVTLSATVTSPRGTVNEGAVTFTLVDGQGHTFGSPVTSGTVSGGAATAPFTIPAGTPVSTFTIQARYNDLSPGDYLTSADTAQTLSVGPAATTTATTLATATYSAASQGVSLSATVTSAAGPVTEGAVTFTVLDNQGHTVGTPITSGTVTAGAAGATYTLPAATPPGSYTIQAQYNDAAGEFQADTDKTQVLLVQAGTVTTASGLNVVFSEAPQNVTLSATVTSTVGTVSGGVVTFTVFDGHNNQVGSPVTSGAVAGGVASVSYALPAGVPAGTYKVVATYSGTDLLNAGPQAGQAFWSGYGGNARHTADSPVAGQPMQGIVWQSSVDLDPQYSGNELLIHYGEPAVTQANTLIIPVKVGATDGFELQARDGYTGALRWTVTTDYVLPSHNWTPSFDMVMTPSGRVYFAGAGGTVYYFDNPDSLTPPTVHQLAFYGLSNYQANPGAFNGSVFIDTPLTADANGDVFFGFRVQGTAPAPLGSTQSGYARIDASGGGTYRLVGAITGDANIGRDSHNAAPALSNDGQTLYVIAKAASSNFYAYLVALDATTLATKSEVFLRDPRNGQGADIPEDGTASPLVGPDGDVYFGVLGNPFNGSRGFLLHYDATLATQKTTGAFGWDDTPSIVPASMVPGYTGTSSYLIFTKYNNYVAAEVGNTGGDGVNLIAVLDPNATQPDARNDAIPPNGSNDPSLSVMKEAMTIAGPTPDTGFTGAGFPNAVREWCINNAVVDPGSDSIFVNSEDGKFYRWSLATNTLSQTVTLTTGLGEAYTPTWMGPDGKVYAINNATIFAVGVTGDFFQGSSDSAHTFGVTPAATATAAEPAGVPFSQAGQRVMLSATVISGAGAVNEGTVTFSVLSGTAVVGPPMTSGTVSGGVASVPFFFPGGVARGTSYTILARYNDAGGNFQASDDGAAPAAFSVGQATANTAVSPALAAASVTNQVVILRAAVNSTGGAADEGTVTFTVLNGTTPVGAPVTSGVLVGGTASAGSASAGFVLPGGTPAGHYTIQAVYSGGPDFLPGATATGTLTVDAPPVLPAVNGTGTITLPHNQFPTTVPLGASSPIGNALSYTAAAIGDSLLFDVQQQYRFQPAGVHTAGPTAFVLQATTGNNGFGNPFYLIRPSDGALFPYDGSGTYANTTSGTPLATLGANVFTDPTLLLNAKSPVDYATLQSVQQQFQFASLGVHTAGPAALVLQSAAGNNGFGNPMYLVRPSDGGLFPYDGSGSYANITSGKPIATLGAGVFADPSLLLNAQAPPALYSQLYRLNQQYDLQELNGSFLLNNLGHQAEWFYSPVLNAFGQHWYTLTLSADGTQALLRPWQGYQDSATGPVLAALDPSVYAHPQWLVNATALPNAGLGATVDGAGNLTLALADSRVAGSFKVTVTASDGFLSATQTVLVTATDAAPTLTVTQGPTAVAPGGTLAFAHGSFPQTFAVATADAEGDAVTAAASAAPFDQLFALEQQYRFQPVGTMTAGGASAFVLQAAGANAFGNTSYLLRPSDGALFADDGTGNYTHAFAAAPPLAALGSVVGADPTLLTNAKPPVDYATLSALQQQHQFTSLGVHTAGPAAVVLQAAAGPNGFGNLLYLLRADGALFPYDGSGTYNNTTAGTPLAVLDPSVYADPTLLTNALAAPGLYVQLAQVERQLDLSGVGYAIAGAPAYVLKAPLNNGGGNPYYLLRADGALFAYDGSGSYAHSFANPANQVAALDPSVYTTPTLLTNAKAPPAAVGATASVSGGVLTVNSPSSFVGTFQVTVKVSDGIKTTAQTFFVSATDTPPAVSPVGNQTVSASGPALQLTLAAGDAENDPVTFAAQAAGYSAAYALQQQYHFQGVGSFTTPDGVTAYVLQIMGTNANGNPFYLLKSDGGLYAYDGSGSYGHTFGNAANLVATLDPSVFANPVLLTNAQPPTAPPAAAMSVSVTGTTLTVSAMGKLLGLAPGTVFEVFVTASDGAETTRTGFVVTVSA